MKSDENGSSSFKEHLEEFTQNSVEKLRNWDYEKKDKRQGTQIQKTQYPIWQTGADGSSSD